MHDRSPSYVYGLDLIRFTCALMVCIFHFTWQVRDAAWYMPIGWVGVQIFFVISGVVIANSASGTTPAQFLKGRFLRIYPAAWIAGILNTLFLSVLAIQEYKSLGLHLDSSPEAVNHSFLLLWGPFLATSYWTLPIEIAFYGLIFLSLFFGGSKHFLRIARALILVGAPYLLGLALHQSGKIDVPSLELGYGRKNLTLLRHGIFFAIGIYLWSAANRGRLTKLDKLLLSVAMFAASLEIYCRAVTVLPAYGRPTDVWVLSSTAVATFFAAVWAISFSLGRADELIPREKGKKVLRNLGLITYPLYLIHEAIGGYFLHWAKSSGFSLPLSVLIGAGMSVTVAYIVASRLEPALREGITALFSWFTRPSLQR